MWSDMIGNIIGLVALALGWRRSMLTWPVQFALRRSSSSPPSPPPTSPAASASRSSSSVVAVWGWWQWTAAAAGAEDGHIAVRFATWRERGGSGRRRRLGTVAVGRLFKAYPSLSWNPWPDAYIFVGTLVAMYAQARGMVEFWFAWLLVDLVGVPLNFANGCAFSGFVYVIYGALVLWGMRDWWLRSRGARGPPWKERTA